MSVFQPDLLRGRVAFVAGGTSGINLGIAHALAAHGAAISVMSRSEEKVAAAIADLARHGTPVSGQSGDVRTYAAAEAALRAVAETFGPPDIIVSGAAGNFVAPAAKLSANAFKTVVDIDLLGTFNVLRASYDVCRKPGTSMINISAGQSTTAHWGQAHVSAAKAGVDMLTRSLAGEWGVEGIRVNAIVPGPIDGTEGMARLAPTPEARREIESRIALRRYGTRDEVANLAVFLASDAASYVTGAIMYCDGGSVLSGARGQPAGFGGNE
ncbi:MAG: SDR family oxidoreductase [Gemmatimonadales bacterium]|nr:SDR family oxidoreductase [Gemmatimonadales bacterium]